MAPTIRDLALALGMLRRNRSYELQDTDEHYLRTQRSAGERYAAPGDLDYPKCSDMHRRASDHHSGETRFLPQVGGAILGLSVSFGDRRDHSLSSQ